MMIIDYIINSTSIVLAKEVKYFMKKSKKMNSLNEIVRVMRQTAERKGYTLEERKSTSTSSWYFKLHSGEFSLLFRISDHKTKSDVVTLRTDYNLTEKAVVGFINNRCRDLSDRKLKGLLGI